MQTPQDGPPRTYESRPVRIQAVRWDGSEEQAEAIIEWIEGIRGRGAACYIEGQDPVELNYADQGEPVLLERPARIVIGTPEGQMSLHAGGWAIRGTEDEFYPCKDSVFQRKYAEAWN